MQSLLFVHKHSLRSDKKTSHLTPSKQYRQHISILVRQPPLQQLELSNLITYDIFGTWKYCYSKRMWSICIYGAFICKFIFQVKASHIPTWYKFILSLTLKNPRPINQYPHIRINRFLLRRTIGPQTSFKGLSCQQLGGPEGHHRT